MKNDEASNSKDLGGIFQKQNYMFGPVKICNEIKFATLVMFLHLTSWLQTD